jgi:serine/threonine-protein kinase
VIHRDIKPENIPLTLDGDTLVADFGIARALGPNEERLTQAGLALGTPAYMAPEQATGERTVDARTDLYSLAIVCYEMLVGRPPFEGATPPAVIAKRLTSPAPSARAVRPEVSEAVDRTLQRGLALDPAERFGSLAEFVGALGGAIGGTPPGGVAAIPDLVPAPAPRSGPASPASRPSRRLVLVLCLLAAVVVVAVLFAVRK